MAVLRLCDVKHEDCLKSYYKHHSELDSESHQIDFQLLWETKSSLV
jgi:hypothetical protein